MIYKTSKDYKRLYALLNPQYGNVIVAFVDYKASELDKYALTDVIKVFQHVPGTIYGGKHIHVTDWIAERLKKSVRDVFIDQCKNFNLRFIDPDSQK